MERDGSIVAREAERAPLHEPAVPLPTGKLAQAAEHYRGIFAEFSDGDVAPAKAPVPDDLPRRSVDVKGGAYFMDADMAGICLVQETAWYAGKARSSHTHALVVLVSHARLPEKDNHARGWLEPALNEVAELRACEIALTLAGHIRTMGFSAKAHSVGDCQVDRERLAVLAGLAVRVGDHIEAPFIGSEFAIGAVTTDYELATETPLAASALEPAGMKYWWGINGAVSGRERNRRAKRASHRSKYPMEQVKRIDRPTTLIIDDEVPRVPKRAAFFQRALHGDLGEKAKRERGRFAFKTPFAHSLLGAIRSMVPHQDGSLAKEVSDGFANAEENAKAVKSLAYALGADLAGICEVPRYAWFSHNADGSEIKPYHRFAVVMLIDQGYDTMEGASGDDWVSGAQSMRAYLRGAEIAGVMAQFLRDNGVAARAQTNADSDVLQIPLILWAGLGELSRIGELVLNPFVGPRFKSVVMTTDLPLKVDRPIDFGLQYFCSNCYKCARECPCDAIPFGGKVMFNGYETWKPDVERCTRYRLTNQRGAACGRCMKTCPINKVVDADGALLTRVASWLGVNAMGLKPLMVPIATWVDDKLGNGMRNPAKKWWFDHEVIDGVTVDPPKGTNERDIDPARKFDAAKQKMAFYPASMMPPPDDQGEHLVDRKSALAVGAELEMPDEARKRIMVHGAPPGHYKPAPPAGRSGKAAAKTPYE
ncbi:MAG: Fe-S protein [Hyphomicrobiales bacterium]